MSGPLPRRVLHVMNNPVGGSAESTLALIHDLAARGIESAAVCHATGPADAMAAVEDAVDGRLLVTRLWWWNRRTRAAWWRRPVTDARESLLTGRGIRSARRIVQWARGQAIDLVHTNTILVPEGARVASTLGLPHVWHVRELVGPGHPFRFWCEPWFVRHRVGARCEVLIANSEATLHTLDRWLPPGRGVVIPNGIDVDRFGALPARPDGTREVVVGMVANLTSRWKDHDLFIRAAARVDRATPARFVLVGRDPVLEGVADDYAEGLHRLVARSGLDGRFEFAGFAADPVEAMAGLDVLVHPCGEESFGRVAIEAMAAGRPVIGVAAGGIGEVVRDGETGVLVAPGDEQALARAIERLVGDGDARLRLGEEGRRVARSRYRRDAHADAVVAAYAQAVRRSVKGYHPRPSRRVP